MADRYTSDLAAALAPDVLERFQRYVRLDTQSSRERERSPSSPGQLELARLLCAELLELGLADAQVDENGYVMATLPASASVADGDSDSGPAFGLMAHLDTTPDVSGRGVEPIVHPGYDGGVIELPKQGTRLDPAAMPELRAKVGHDIVTASGDTLLGADDKAGMAEIMAAVGYLASHPEAPRPTIRIAFTPDEEIGLGASLFDLDRFGCAFAYTLDGSELGELQDETFSALEVLITLRGVDVHPGQATGKMVSALRLAARLVDRLPSDRLTPDTSSDMEGYIHPYELNATADQAQIRLILRDFDDALLNQHLALLRQAAEEVVASDARAALDFQVHRQYSNMRRYLDAVPEVMEAAEEAIRAEGIEPLRIPIRGGTDGSLLSEMGLPTANLFTGGHEYHSVREWSSVQDMAAAAAVLIRLAEVWARRDPGAVKPLAGRS
ncbi:MAG TPA: peptidase T [Solirubrobacteraceae bacterium]|nr:peptidase T [Solirubrobacteraceae bacterium]